MKKIWNNSWLILLSLSFGVSQAQTGKVISRDHEHQKFSCATPVPDAKWDAWFNNLVEEHKSSRTTIANYTIPVIIHVVHSGQAVGTAPNISNAQLVSQIQVLNDDYSGNGYNVNTVPSVFASLVSNTGVQFCLATKDENGNTLTEPGVDRINISTHGWTNPSSFTDDNTFQNYLNNTIKPNSIWDPVKYMNIWVTDRPSNGGLLGYSTFPAGTGLSGLTSGTGTSSDDGFWCYAKCWGTTGSLLSGYNKGRVPSHEIGHFLGLRHTWGDSNCGTDYCNDTPPSQQSNYNCPTHPYNQGGCSGNTTGEMTMNFMDYTSDACKYMFTPDQTARIQTAMANCPQRKFLGTHGVCNTGPSAPVANFSANKTTICPGTAVTFTDASTNSPTSWSWTFQGGTPATSTSQNPSVTYSTPGTYSVQLVASNSIGNDTEVKTSYITVSSVIALPLVEGFEATTFPPVNWTTKNINSDAIFFERKTSVGGFGTSSNCMWFDNYNNDTRGGIRDEIHTPKYNMSGLGSVTMTFDVAYARYDAQYSDTLAVLVSTDCGATFTVVYVKGGTPLATAPDKTNAVFVPTSSQWRTETINLNAYAGQANVMIAFQNRGQYGQALYIDNINISGVSSLPVTNFTFGNNNCAGQAVNFTDQSSNSPTSWSWSFQGGSPSTSTQQNPTITFTNAGTYTVSLVASNNAGAGSTNTQTVTIVALPNVQSTTSDNSICAGQSTNLSASGANSYVWSPGNQTSSSITVSPASTTTYSVTGTSNGCSNSSSVTINVTALPNVQSTASDNSICAGQSTNLSASGASSYVWSPGNQTSSSITVSPAASTTYSVTGTSNGCSNSSSLIITVNNPITPSISQNGNNLTASPSSGGTYQWYLNGSAINGATSSSYNCTANGNYTVEYTDANGCSATSAVHSVSVVGLPEVAQSQIFIYPNPTSGTISIKWLGASTVMEIDLVNAIGQTIFAKKRIETTETDIDMYQLSDGVYYLRVYGEAGISEYKIIKK